MQLDLPVEANFGGPAEHLELTLTCIGMPVGGAGTTFAWRGVAFGGLEARIGSPWPASGNPLGGWRPLWAAFRYLWGLWGLLLATLKRLWGVSGLTLRRLRVLVGGLGTP